MDDYLAELRLAAEEAKRDERNLIKDIYSKAAGELAEVTAGMTNVGRVAGDTLDSITYALNDIRISTGALKAAETEAVMTIPYRAHRGYIDYGQVGVYPTYQFEPLTLRDASPAKEWIDEIDEWAKKQQQDPVVSSWTKKSREFWRDITKTRTALDALREENRALHLQLNKQALLDTTTVRISKDHAKVVKDLISLWRNCPYDDTFFFEQMERIVSSLETENFSSGTGEMEAIVSLRKVIEERGTR